MNIIDIKDKKMFLSNLGTIITGEKEYSIDDFENLLNRSGGYYFEPLEFAYDSEKMYFTVKVISKQKESDFYKDYGEEDYDGIRINYLYMTDGQKSLLEQGIVDDNVQKLIGLAEKSQYEKKQREIHLKALETGEYPTSREDIKIYKDYFKEQLIQTNAKLTTNRMFLFSPVLSAGLCALFFASAFKVAELDYNIAANFLMLGGLFSGSYIPAFGLSSLALDEISPFRLNKKIKKDLKFLKQKIKELEEMDKDKALFDVSVELSPEGLEHSEVTSVSQYRNVFLREINEVKKSIAKLPKEEREEFVNALATLLAKYIKEVENLIDKDSTKVELGSASHIWELNSLMLPDVFRLGALVNERLATIKEKREVLKGCQEVKKSIDDLSTDKEYTDGWTDDLTSGGVAYAFMENESVTSRKKA